MAVAAFALARNRTNKDDLPLGFRLNPFADRAEWFSTQTKEFGAELRRYVPTGRVLTLAPSWPLAGGLEIYPEFATGPFAWRSAEFLAAERRPGLKIVAPADLETYLAPNPPGGILTGVEDDDLEEPLIRFAEKHGYEEIRVSRKRKLWIPAEKR